jgi:predicted choloylglycine hydrolase
MDVDESSETNSVPQPVKTRRRWRIARRILLALVVVCAVAGYSLKGYYRTLHSLRRVPGTKAYVMDYYVDYHIDEIRAHGIDVEHVEDSLIAVLLPRWTQPVAERLKWVFLDEQVEPIETTEHCSTVVIHPKNGDVLFGRNFDYSHDAYLILKIHGRDSMSSVAVLDLHYLNLDRDDLEQSSLFERIPLLFAPYYLQDGMNQYGVAVADMSVDGVRTPHDPAKPNVIHSLAMRLILDYAKNANEAIDLVKRYNIFFVQETCHLMIADAAGKSVVVEFVDGELKATPTEEIWQVCTNHQIAGKSEDENDAACDRYRTASDELAKAGSTASVADVMTIMKSVQKDTTMWTSVYDLNTLDFEVSYRQDAGDRYIDRLAK